MRIRFTKTYHVKAMDGETYHEGRAYDMSLPSCQHFINKGVAVEVAGGKVEAPETASVEPAETAVRPRGRTRTATAE